jgi:integrase
VADVADPDIILKIRDLGLQEGWSPSTVDRLLATVRAVLKRAQAWRHIDTVPHIPMYGQPQAEPRWLTVGEFQALCRELPPHLALAARFAVLTGLRMRAMLKLTWDRVDLDNRRAWVPASHMKAGKTLALSLSPAAVQVLLKLRALNPSGPWVFQWNERPIDDCNTRAFQAAVKRAGVGPLRWHDLRHTFASWAVQNGVRLEELMQLGGWSDYRMALRYGHLAPSQVASAAERVANMLQTPQTAETGSASSDITGIKELGGGAAGDRTPDLRIAKAAGRR